MARRRGAGAARGGRLDRTSGAGQDDRPLVGASVRADLDGHLETLSLCVSISATARARAGVVRLGCRAVDRWTPVAHVVRVPARRQRHLPRWRWRRRLLVVCARCSSSASRSGRRPLVGWRGELDGAALIRNSSIVRPIAIAAVLLILAGYRRMGLRTGIAAAFVLILPIEGYHRILERMTTPDRPLSVIARLCREDPQIRRGRGRGVLQRGGARRRASLLLLPASCRPLARRRPSSRRPVAAAALRRGRADADRPVAEGLRTAHRARRRVVDGAELAFRASVCCTGIAPEEPVVVLLPGPYAACVAPAVAAGGEEVGDIPQRRSQWR